MENLSNLALSSPVGAQLPAHLVGPTSRYVEAGLRGAANTIRAYAGDWARFTTWCQLHQLDSLPAPAEALAGFLTELAEAGKKVATIQRHAAAIAKAHELAGLDSPTADKKIKVQGHRARKEDAHQTGGGLYAGHLQTHHQEHRRIDPHRPAQPGPTAAGFHRGFSSLRA